MKTLLIITAALLVVGCAPEPRLDVSQLDDGDTVIAVEAANLERMPTTAQADEYDWTVKYEITPGFNGRYWRGGYGECEIRVNPEAIKCLTRAARDELLLRVLRHEIRHCNGAEHIEGDPIMSSDDGCDYTG